MTIHILIYKSEELKAFKKAKIIILPVNKGHGILKDNFLLLKDSPKAESGFRLAVNKATDTKLFCRKLN